MKTSKVSWKVYKLQKMHDTKRVNFDLVIQRKDNIWDNKRQSTLIHSILSNFPISTLYATKEDVLYNFLDGKQRLGSILNYMDDGYKLHLRTPTIDGVTIAGLKFSELPEELQQKIYQYEIDFVKIEEISQEEMEELFFRLNNGVPLRQIETTRAILGSKVLRFVETVASMDFFANKVNIASSSRKRFVDQEMILQILALIHNADTGFSGKELQVFVEKLKELEIQDNLRAKMQNATYYLNEAFPKKEKFLKKIHVPMLFSIVLELIEKGELPYLSATEFGNWARDFFTNTPEEYTNACLSGSARKEKVQKRLSVMRENFQEFLNAKKATSESDEALMEDLNPLESEEAV